MADKPSKGLADVVAAATALSDIDGRAGRLSYRGYDVHQLAGSAAFEEVACLLQPGRPPSTAGLSGYRAGPAAGRAAGKLRPARRGRRVPGPDHGPGLSTARCTAKRTSRSCGW